MVSFLQIIPKSKMTDKAQLLSVKQELQKEIIIKPMTITASTYLANHVPERPCFQHFTC